MKMGNIYGNNWFKIIRNCGRLEKYPSMSNGEN